MGLNKYGLKPCPFPNCGSSEAYANGGNDEVRVCWITCSGCGASTRNFNTLKEAKEFWNNREINRKLVPIEELVGMICGIDCGTNPWITIEDVREEILSRFLTKGVNHE